LFDYFITVLKTKNINMKRMDRNPISIKTVASFFVMIGLLFIWQDSQAQISYQGELKTREIKRGKGQEFSEEFRFTQDFQFIQFGVYPTDTDIDKIKAPKGVGQVWLIWHPHTSIQNVREKGAIYIVKPVFSEQEARDQVAMFKKKGIKSWYNKQLTGVSFTLLGFTESIVK
jgi:hypothetical protein